ncbi:MAG: tetratricopeptide repeat protein [bacterium]
MRNSTMDRLDIVSISLIMILSILATGMVAMHREAAHSPQSQEAKAAPARQGSGDVNVFQEVDALIKSARYDEALNALRKTMEKYPKNPESQVYLAAIYNRQGDMEKAISLCRQSIEKNPDLLELATANLKDLVQKGIPKLQREKELKPNDEKVSTLLRDLYFCQRKLGQGCE